MRRASFEISKSKALICTKFEITLKFCIFFQPDETVYFGKKSIFSK